MKLASFSKLTLSFSFSMASQTFKFKPQLIIVLCQTNVPTIQNNTLQEYIHNNWHACIATPLRLTQYKYHLKFWIATFLKFFLQYLLAMYLTSIHLYFSFFHFENNQSKSIVQFSMPNQQ